MTPSYPYPLQLGKGKESEMIVKEIECKSILSKSGLADYALNCYVGCQHACRYCYARFMGRWRADGLPWGEFVFPKANAPEVLKREAKRCRRGEVFVSSVCDGWQPLEERYRLTRQCLEILLEEEFPVTILTKSNLLAHDLELLKEKSHLVELGLTITTLDETLAGRIEPHASSPVKRLETLKEAVRMGLTVYAFFGPLMPCLSDTEENIAGLLEAIKPLNLSHFYVDMLNPRWGVWPSLKLLLEEHYPGLLEEYRGVLFNESARGAYARIFRQRVKGLARDYGLEKGLRFCF
jgi:DNA repair photolyase